MNMMYSIPNHVESVKIFGDFPEGYIEREIGELEKSANRSLKWIEFHNIGNNNCRQIYKFHPVNFERVRRITGYLVGDLNRFNDAKRHEVEDRLKHGA